MRQLVPQRAIDLRRAVFLQTGTQRNEGIARIGPARCAAQTRVPFYPHRFA
jgi:hypothetical protein